MHSNFLGKTILLLTAVFCCMIAILNIIQICFWAVQVNLTAVSILLFILILLILVFLLYLLLRYNILLFVKNPIIFGSVLFLVSLILKGLFVVIINTKQYSDFQLFYWVTTQIAENNFKYLSQDYFKVWSYQIGFPAIMSIFAKAASYNILPLVLLNCVFISLSNLIIYQIARLFSSEKVARFIAVLYLFFPFTYGLCSVYTNQHLAVLFFYSGIFVFLKQKRYSLFMSILSGVLLSIGNAVRPECITIVLSFGAFFVIILFNNLRTLKCFLKREFPQIITVLATYFIFFTLISQIFVFSGLNPSGLKNNFPLYKFVVGLNSNTGGTYSNSDAKILLSEFKDPKLRNIQAISMIKSRLSIQPKNLFKLFINKLNVMWTCNNKYPSFHDIPDNKKLSIGISASSFIKYFTFTDFLFFIFVFLSTSMSMIIMLKSKIFKKKYIFFSLLFLINFAIYLFIEVQHRYCDFIMPAVFLLTIPFLNLISTKIKFKNIEKNKVNFDKKNISLSYRS